MSVFGPGAAVAAMGLNPNPVGTPEELRNENLDLRVIGSCAPARPGVCGCQFYENCIFRFTRFGGFRDEGPRNVGYFLQTHEGSKKEDQGSCHFFMSRLYDRMRAGQRDREDGKNGEIIQIIALEEGGDHPLSGEKIHRGYTVNVNDGTNLPSKYEKKIFTGPVTPFPRPSERVALSYDSLLEDRRRTRELTDESLQMGPVMRINPDEVEQDEIEGEGDGLPTEEELAALRDQGKEDDPRKDA